MYFIQHCFATGCRVDALLHGDLINSICDAEKLKTKCGSNSYKLCIISVRLMLAYCVGGPM